MIRLFKTLRGRRLFAALLLSISIMLSGCGSSLTSSDLTAASDEAMTSTASAASSEAAEEITTSAGTKASKEAESIEETAPEETFAGESSSVSETTAQSAAQSNLETARPAADSSAAETKKQAETTKASETKEAQTKAVETKAPETTEPETTAPEAAKSCCTLVIDGGGSEGIYFSGQVEISDSTTVYDVLCQSGVTIDGSSTYIKAINNLREKEHGPMSGWLYDVNGVTPMKSCGAYYLSDGDSVYWHYLYDE